MTARPVHDGRKYRRLTLGLVALGVVALFVATEVDRYLLGLAVYAVAGVAAFATVGYARFSGSVALGDERENELERRASHLTFQLFGYVGWFVFVALFLLDAAGRLTLGATAETLLYAYAAVSLAWGVVYLLLRYRP